LDCGSLLPLCLQQPAAEEAVVSMFVQQQAVGRKAAAGCRSPNQINSTQNGISYDTTSVSGPIEGLV